MRKSIITKYPVLRYFNYRRQNKSKQENKGILLQLIPLFSLLISLCSIYIAYKSLKLSATEKGAETEAKAVSDLEQTPNWKDISVSIQNVSNSQIGVNSAYILVYEIESEKYINYKGILKNQRISFTRIEPFAKQFDTLKAVFGSDFTSISEQNINNIIFEFRIYYSRLFDGKIYGTRSFFATEGEPNLKYYLFKNEEQIKHSIEFFNHSPEMLKDFPDYVSAKKNDIFKINFIEKLKSEKFLKDSLRIIKGLDYYPPLDEPFLSPNAQYSINVKTQ